MKTRGTVVASVKYAEDYLMNIYFINQNQAITNESNEIT
jgi:hypothetical protein